MALDPVIRPDDGPASSGAVSPRLQLVTLEPDVPRKRGLDRARCPGVLCGCVSEGAFCDDGCRASDRGQLACDCGHDTCRRPIGRL